MRFLVVALLLVSLLAGCADEPAPVTEDEEPTLVTDPTDLEAGNSSGEHLHDYWGGQDRLTLHDEEAGSGGGLISDCGGYAWFVFRPDPDHTVIQGTASVEITLDWTDDEGSLYTDPELWIRTAKDDQAHFVADVEPGETVVFESTNAANDLPHQTLSAWEFHWVIHPGDDADPFCDLQFVGTMEFRSEIVRGLEIPLYPGHPDRWDNATEMLVLDETKSVFLDQGTDMEGNGLCLSGDGEDGGCFWDDHRPSEGRVVPHDARTVEVTITHANDPFDIAFAYHGADTREWTPMEPTMEDGDTRTYLIDVGAAGDGPYAKQSLWEFRVVPDSAGDLYVDGQYAITATALRA